MCETWVPKFMVYTTYSQFLKGILKKDLNDRDANIICQLFEWAGRQQPISPKVAIDMEIHQPAPEAVRAHMAPSIMSQEIHYIGGTSVIQLDPLSIDVDQKRVLMDINMDMAIQQPAPGAVGDHMVHFEMVPEIHSITGTSVVQTAFLSPFVEHQMEEKTAVDQHKKGIGNNTEVKMFDDLELPDSQPAAYLELLKRNLLGFICVANCWRSVWANKGKSHDINDAKQ
jgi:hypothetical protein